MQQAMEARDWYYEYYAAYPDDPDIAKTFKVA